MALNENSGTILDELSFEVGGETSKAVEPVVLSCGGIYIPYREIPSDLKKWQQIVSLPSKEISARMFEMTLDLSNPLDNFLRKEFLN